MYTCIHVSVYICLLVCFVCTRCGLHVNVFQCVRSTTCMYVHIIHPVCISGVLVGQLITATNKWMVSSFNANVHTHAYMHTFTHMHTSYCPPTYCTNHHYTTTISEPTQINSGSTPTPTPLSTNLRHHFYQQTYAIISIQRNLNQTKLKTARSIISCKCSRSVPVYLISVPKPSDDGLDCVG